MRLILLIFITALYGCVKSKPLDRPVDMQAEIERHSNQEEMDTLGIYNERFRRIRIKKMGAGKYKVTGEARVFEAALSWIVEDGHDEIAQGHAMAGAGAPEWGSFEFDISVDKEHTNRVLHLVLFEASAKDGTRRFELPIKLSQTQ